MKKTKYGCIIVISILLLAGCQAEHYQKVDSAADQFIVVNLIESSLSFYDERTRKEIANWELPYTFTGGLILPNQEHLLLYGKHLDNLYLYDMSTGKRDAVWKSGQGIVNAILSKDHSQIYLADQENDRIVILSLEGELIGEINVGDDPLTMLENDKGTLLYVINFEDPRIHVIDLESRKIVQIINGKTATVGAVLLESSNELWTGGHGDGDKVGNSISIYSLTDGQLLDEIVAPIMPVDFEKNGPYIYVVSHGSNQLRKIDAKTRGIIEEIEIGANPFEISINKELIYSASYDSDEIVIVDPTSMKVVDKVKTGRGPFQVLFKRGENHE